MKKEKEFTKQALKIAIVAKLKKEMMYKKQGLSDSQSIIKVVTDNDLTLMKTSGSYQALPTLKAPLRQSTSMIMNPSLNNTTTNAKNP